jgi:hypothetical protein
MEELTCHPLCQGYWPQGCCYNTASQKNSEGTKIVSDPKWYDDMSRKNRDRVDQALHFVVIGFLPSILVTAAPSFAYVWWREFVHQAPIDRIDDTIRDIKFCMMGAVCGQVIHTAAWVCALICLV